MQRIARVLVLLVLFGLMIATAPRPAGAFCIFDCSYAKTKYPIALAHGLGGFRRALRGLAAELLVLGSSASAGCATAARRCSSTEARQLNPGPSARGEQLIDQIETHRRHSPASLR